MTWGSDDQATAERTANSFASDYADALAAWKIAVQTGGNAIAAKGRVTDVVDRWRTSVSSLEQQSDTIMSDQNAMDTLGQVATQVAEERATLTKLRSEAGTRSNQADSVNPKIRTSPYTNILGLQRAFRESTRFTILIMSIVFGILALVALGFLSFSMSGPLVSAVSTAARAVAGAAAGAAASTVAGVRGVAPVGFVGI